MHAFVDLEGAQVVVFECHSGDEHRDRGVHAQYFLLHALEVFEFLETIVSELILRNVLRYLLPDFSQDLGVLGQSVDHHAGGRHGGLGTRKHKNRQFVNESADGNILIPLTAVLFQLIIFHERLYDIGWLLACRGMRLYVFDPFEDESFSHRPEFLNVFIDLTVYCPKSQPS